MRTREEAEVRINHWKAGCSCWIWKTIGKLKIGYAIIRWRRKLKSLKKD